MNKGELERNSQKNTRTENRLILKLSIDGFIIFSTKNAKAIIDYEPEELIGTHIENLIHEKEFVNLTELFSSNVEEVCSSSLRLLTKAGHAIWCDVTFAVVYEGSRSLQEVILIIQPVANKSIEDHELINNEKLKIAGQLAAGVAHEIKNPLTSIKGFIQLMKADTVVNKKYLEIVEHEIQRLEGISHELLVLAKPQEHDVQINDLVVLVNEVVLLMEAEAMQKGIQFHMIADDQPYMVLCDRNKIKQVLINMIKNGIEAMDRMGFITITLSSCENDVQMAIRDEGRGIPEEHLEKLGNPFFSTKENGNGLGLMVSQKIISEHNGKISVESSSNGTTFHIHLPLI
ncbi:ATP-binding protein [Niallia sp. Krafla_26]|uniref:ATP-binding protein n=1 Tax=Niallia sp. Krafla_26 TaxID=3064703 RepID=UPI003D178AB5